jgi:hypothetical protein
MMHGSTNIKFLTTVARGVQPHGIVKQKHINVSEQHIVFIFRVKDRTYCKASPLGGQLYSHFFLKGVITAFRMFRNTREYETASLAHNLQVYKAQAKIH